MRADMSSTVNNFYMSIHLNSVRKCVRKWWTDRAPPETSRTWTSLPLSVSAGVDTVLQGSFTDAQ